MKTTFVNIRPEIRSDTGKEQFILTWHPRRGIRKRRCCDSRAAAESEAARIDKMLRLGVPAATQILPDEVAALITMWGQLPKGTRALDVISFYSRHHRPTNSVLIETVGAEYAQSRDNENFSERHTTTVAQHINRFTLAFPKRALASVTAQEIADYLDTIGNCGKTRLQHLVTLRAFYRWARKRGYLPYGEAVAPEDVDAPKWKKTEHEIYSPEEFMRLLVFTPPRLITFMVLGQFASIRAAERGRLFWRHWREDEGDRIVCNTDVTKTERRRAIDVSPNLAEWLSMVRGKPDEKMFPYKWPYSMTSKIAQDAGLRWKPNALRAGYCSYHAEYYDNLPLTAKNSGHSIEELETVYKSISGVTKTTAKKMFGITPAATLQFAIKERLPVPEWAELVQNSLAQKEKG